MDADVIIIGGGAAGALAGVYCGQWGKKTLIFEPNGKIGKKLAITGKGRCNVTNNCTDDELMQNIPVNSRFLCSVLLLSLLPDIKFLLRRFLEYIPIITAPFLSFLLSEAFSESSNYKICCRYSADWEPCRVSGNHKC